MTYPFRFIQVYFSDWDIDKYTYGYITDPDAAWVDFQRDVEMAHKLISDQQQFVPKIEVHRVVSSKPAAYWAMFDPLRPHLLNPHSIRWDWRIDHHGNPQIAEVRAGTRSVNDLFVAIDNQVDGNPEVWAYSNVKDLDLIARIGSLTDPRTATSQLILAVLGAHNDLRGWQEGTGPGGRPSKIPVSDKRGQGGNVNAILEQLLVQEGGFPPSEGVVDPVDYMRNRQSRQTVEVLGGQGETDREHGGGDIGGYAGGAWRGPVAEWPLNNWGFGVVGGWRRKFSLLARHLHNEDVRDPKARIRVLDKAPDCRDRLMLKEWQEPRLNGGFAAQHPSHAILHEGTGHGCNIDIHNPDLTELPDGTLVFGTDEQRAVFIQFNAAYLEPKEVEPVPEPKPEPEPLKIIDLSCPDSITVPVRRPRNFTVAALMSDGSTPLVVPTVEERDPSNKFSAAVGSTGIVTVVGGKQPGEAYMVVRYAGIEKIVKVIVVRR